MKKLFFAVLTLVGTNSFAGTGLNYVCALNGGNQATIQVTANTVTAELAHNNTNTHFTLTETSLVKKAYVLFVLDTEKTEAPEKLRLAFNLTYPSVSLHSVDQNGNATELEKAACKKVK